MKVVFLDRDGVINEFPGKDNYVTKVKDFHFIPGAAEAIARLSQAGYKIFVISNQAGVGKGVYSLDKLNRINRYMMKHVEAAGGEIRKSFYCTHRADAGCDCRKPGIGLLKKALQSLNKTIAHAQKAFFVGDTEGDIKTGHNAGCKTVFVLCGRESRRHMRQWHIKPDFIASDLKTAVDIIQHENSGHSRHSRGRA
ncbi:MAG: HAD family hydrolase [Candidatus Omnitrophica bacterium]|nr:HAD family hydrolase [Candidatus Omnitrophota bacterium]